MIIDNLFFANITTINSWLSTVLNIKILKDIYIAHHRCKWYCINYTHNDNNIDLNKLCLFFNSLIKFNQCFLYRFKLEKFYIKVALN